MPQIDAGPNDYRKKDPKTGQWRLPDDPKFYRNMMVVPLIILLLIFLWRDEFTTASLFGGAAMMAFCAGGFFALWLKDHY